MTKHTDHMAAKQKPLKILHIIPSVGPIKGGPSYAALNTCRALARAGIDVTLATSDDNGPTRLDVPLGVPIEQDGYTTIYFRRIFREYTFCWAITPWLIRNIKEFDFIHIHAVFSYTSVLAGILAIILRVPFAVRPAGILLSWGIESHRTLAKQVHYRAFEKPILNRAAFVQAMTITEADELVQLGIMAPIEVLYHGLETPTLVRDAEGFPDNLDTDFTFLFLGRFHHKKGLDLLLPAFAKAVVEEPRLVLLLAGDGEQLYKDWMNTQIDELGIKDRIRWLGFLDGEQKWTTISSSTAVVMPSYSENFGLVVAEAMICGTPIIVSDGVALSSEVAAADAGVVIPCEMDAITGSILRLARNKDEVSRMRVNAYALAEEKFLLDKVTNDQIRIYERYIGNSKR